MKKEEVKKEKKEAKKKNGKLPGWVIALIVFGCIIFLIPTLLIIGSFILMVASDIDNDSAEHLNISEVNGSYDKDGTYKISGLIRNFGDEECRNLFISYTLYDKDGNILGYATADLERLDEGKTWKFIAKPYELDSLALVDHYELQEIDGDKDWD